MKVFGIELAQISAEQWTGDLSKNEYMFVSVLANERSIWIGVNSLNTTHSVRADSLETAGHDWLCSATEEAPVLCRRVIALMAERMAA